jgi:hypothetical protein
VQYPSAYHLVPAWAIALGLLFVVIMALELGFRLSRRHPQPVVNVAALQASVLGLASLLLAFSYSLAESRFDERRLLVVKEANAVGTLYLRTGYMPEDVKYAMRKRLIRYVALHVSAAESVRDRERTRALLAENDRLQGELWSLLQGHMNDIHPTVLLLMTNALNDVIDTSGRRLAASQTRLPSLVLYLLFTAVIASSLLVGYQPGQEQRNVVHWGIFTVVMVMVMFTLLDLDRPSIGIIRTSLEPLVTLQETLPVFP